MNMMNKKVTINFAKVTTVIVYVALTVWMTVCCRLLSLAWNDTWCGLVCEFKLIFGAREMLFILGGILGMLLAVGIERLSFVDSSLIFSQVFVALGTTPFFEGLNLERLSGNTLFLLFCLGCMSDGKNWYKQSSNNKVEKVRGICYLYMALSTVAFPLVHLVLRWILHCCGILLRY